MADGELAMHSGGVNVSMNSSVALAASELPWEAAGRMPKPATRAAIAKKPFMLSNGG